MNGYYYHYYTIWLITAEVDNFMYVSKYVIYVYVCMYRTGCIIKITEKKICLFHDFLQNVGAC